MPDSCTAVDSKAVRYLVDVLQLICTEVDKEGSMVLGWCTVQKLEEIPLF